MVVKVARVFLKFSRVWYYTYMAIIYKALNTINNKAYIGSTRYTLEQRLYKKPYGHIYLIDNPRLDGKMSIMALHVALREFGKDAFTWEILEEKDNETFATTEDMISWLDEREKFYITKYDSMNTGYNETSGGRSGYKRSESNKLKTSITTKQAMSTMNTKELCNPFKYMNEQEIIEHNLYIAKRTKESMNAKNTKELCNPYKYMNEEERQNYLTNLAKNTSKIMANRRWINNGKIQRFVKGEQLENLLQEGFIFGKLKQKGGQNESDITN